MSKMTMNVDFLIGSNIEDYIKDAKRKAEMLDLAYVNFVINDVSFSIGRHAVVKTVIERYHTDAKYICVS